MEWNGSGRGQEAEPCTRRRWLQRVSPGTLWSDQNDKLCGKSGDGGLLGKNKSKGLVISSQAFCRGFTITLNRFKKSLVRRSGKRAAEQEDQYTYFKANYIDSYNSYKNS